MKKKKRGSSQETKKGIKSKIKNVLKYTLLAVAVNQGSLILSGSLSMMVYSSAFVSIKVNEEKLKPYDHLPRDFNSLDYLMVSSVLVHNQSEGEGDCKDFSNATFKVYQKLTEMNYRDDLTDQIRLVAGEMKDGMGHVQLEYKQDDKFIPFETTRGVLPIEINYIKDYSKWTDRNEDEGLEVVISKTIMGRRIFYPTLNSFYYPGGILKIAYNGGVLFYKELTLEKIEDFLGNIYIS